MGANDKVAATMHGIRQCPHGFHHPPYPHSCDGCWCEGEHDQASYGWVHDTSPVSDTPRKAGGTGT